MPPEPVSPAKLTMPEKNKTPKRIFLVSYPKIIFLYPTLFMALVAGIGSSFMGPELGAPNNVMLATAFLGVLAVNLVVFTFDFPRTTSLTLFFLVAAIVLGLLLLFQFQPHLLPMVTEFISRFKPMVNDTFYYAFAAILAVIFLAMFSSTYLDYWEVRNNELLHHHGFLSDLKRYGAQNVRVDKEITDVFEYFLLRSGRLILQIPGEDRSVVLDNVLFIESKEAVLTRILGSLQVQVQDRNHPEA